MKSYSILVRFEVQVEDDNQKIDSDGKVTFIALNLATVKLQDWSVKGEDGGPRNIPAKFTEYETMSIEEHV